METTVQVIRMDEATRYLCEKEVTIVDLKPRARKHKEYRLTLPDGCPCTTSESMTTGTSYHYTLPSGLILVLGYAWRERGASLNWKPGHSVTAYWLQNRPELAHWLKMLVEEGKSELLTKE